MKSAKKRYNTQDKLISRKKDERTLNMKRLLLLWEEKIAKAATVLFLKYILWASVFIWWIFFNFAQTFI